MKWYFNWNGINSLNKDVLIETLPNVIRPQQRTETIEIEGVDGDIVNTLGYSSYNKVVGISLKNADRLDELSSWLTGTGKVTFSNEPDKFYYATIVEQIEYERLRRFRKANVTFHVQPFKYDLSEQITANTTVINKGTVISKPIITIYGTGEVYILVNNRSYCKILDIQGEITLDSKEQEAYRKGTGILANNRMLGEFPILLPGKNIITWNGTGTITKIETQVRSRWI